jgi:3-dehydroquinate synthase class II
MWEQHRLEKIVNRCREVPAMQIRHLQAHISKTLSMQQRMQFEIATVSRVEAVGMGDRVCVDLCANMAPGEGMLVGNFCRTLFLVHSEVRASGM